MSSVVEPRPKVRVIPTNKSGTYKFFLENVYNIHMDAVYNEFADYIRTIDPEIPLIIENFAYSTPELFPSYAINDPYVVYSFHNYQPSAFNNAGTPYSQTYPGSYFNLTFLSTKFFDKDFFSNTVFANVKAFQQQTGKPVLMGECGIQFPQNGSKQYISDVLDICMDNGWNFALWDWRRGAGMQWNIESFLPDSLKPFSAVPDWAAVLEKFYAPPVPAQIHPVNNQMGIMLPVNFTWEPLTSYTKYDVEIYLGNSLVKRIDNLEGGEYDFDGLLKQGREYSWRIRSKNPGGKINNISRWSTLQNFTIAEDTSGFTFKKNSIQTNELLQNFPNPYNPSTNIVYSIKNESLIKLVVYDLLGREIKVLVNEMKQPGNYSVRFDGSNLPSGVYIYKLDAVSSDGSKSFSSVKRMILIK